MAVTWNSGDKSANVTLSGGSLAATTSSNTQGGVRATSSFGSGKLYYEALLSGSGSGGSLSGVGWANATASLASNLGINTNSFGGFPAAGTLSNVIYNNATLGNMGQKGAVSDVVRVAFDIGGKLIWFSYNGSPWNGSLTADPATGTGGLSVSTIAAGPYFPAFCSNSSTFAVTANFGATPFLWPIPAGFTAVDPTTQAYMASAKFLGYAAEATPQAAVSAAKMLGYAAEAPPQTAMAASKLLGYAIVSTQLPNFSRARQYTYLRE